MRQPAVPTPPGSTAELAVRGDHWRAWQRQARELDFLEMAAAPVHFVKRAKRVTDWVEAGYTADMHWYARSLEKRLNPRLIMEDAASIIILTTPYHPEPVYLAGKKLARYAAGDDYHDVLLKKLRELVARMTADYPAANIRPYVDTGPVLERYWAQEAGLGWIGKNGCLISRHHGSYLFLASMVTNLVVPTGRRHTDFCGSCRACIDACPTDAIVGEGMVDSRKCISYLNIEHRGPFEDAPGFDDWIFGCDICQEVCPWARKFSGPSLIEAFLPRPTYEELTPEDLAEMEQERFSATFRRSPVKRTKMAGIKRNLAHLEHHRQTAEPDPKSGTQSRD
ncbi:tRNA epoxyqueuosine(34) reductase QueG [Sulfidibacter corallicola]|uniref:tRNA epoxyqueuosine(34) reductase QueG n=1 Tax=Sulfidibacter corallicola TaxID=2818388 RepID=A0A8A4TXH4_SULCO|nr:tRNA epoxyqueuosine(34) reductase QueG [Sulfidibacter corallicola]QTD54037.1 tRNA epoxyqueuosine(34) reductase QueG [Sulfidibacter corallicola]